MWFENTVFYQIYPLTVTGAPERNEDPENTALLHKQAGKHRILEIRKFIPHLKKLGVGAVYLNPVFESDSHGYDTRDYRLTDSRLGTNEDLKKLCCRDCHEISSIDEMNFGDYVTIFGNEKQWNKLHIAADRKTFIEELETIRNVRNDVMHFRPAGLDEDRKDLLRHFVEYLRVLVRYIK